MTIMTVRVINAEFESHDEGEYASVEDAYQAALHAGVEIVTSEIMNGKPVAIVEVSVDVAGRTGVRRGAVSLATSLLKSETPAND